MVYCIPYMQTQNTHFFVCQPSNFRNCNLFSDVLLRVSETLSIIYTVNSRNDSLPVDRFFFLLHFQLQSQHIPRLLMKYCLHFSEMKQPAMFYF